MADCPTPWQRKGGLGNQDARNYVRETVDEAELDNPAPDAPVPRDLSSDLYDHTEEWSDPYLPDDIAEELRAQQGRELADFIEVGERFDKSARRIEYERAVQSFRDKEATSKLAKVHKEKLEAELDEEEIALEVLDNDTFIISSFVRQLDDWKKAMTKNPDLSEGIETAEVFRVYMDYVRCLLKL